MRVTDVRVALRNDSRLRAFAVITIDDCFVIRGLKIIESHGSLFVLMPSRRRPDGSYQDIADPISTEARASLEAIVLAKYYEARKQSDDGFESAGVPAPLLPTLGPLIAAMRRAIPRDDDAWQSAG